MTFSHQDIKITYLDHTADIYVLVESSSLESSFAGSLYSMFQYMLSETYQDSFVSTISVSVTVEADTLVNLLYDFLDEMLFKLYENDFIPIIVSELKIEKNNMQGSPHGFLLTANINGCSFDFEKHGYVSEIKAITYHKMEISKETNTIKFIVDI